MIWDWERTRQYNLGFELGLFNNRIRLEGDFYDSQSLDLLLNVPVPTITGYSTQMQNIGKVQNRGMEFTLNTKNLTGEFAWSSNFNISFNKNKVLEVGVDGRLYMEVLQMRIMHLSQSWVSDCQFLWL